MLHLNQFHCFHEQQQLSEDVLISRFHQTAELCGSSLRAGTASLQYTPGPLTLTHLPVTVQLHIFSYLDARSLCRLSRTCTSLNLSAEDSLLWSRLLRRDSLLWSVVGHLSYPPVYTDTDLSPKQVYEACSQRRECSPHRSFSHPLTTRLRSFVRRLQGYVPKLLVVGSGLESLPFIRTLLWEQQSPYKPIGLSPGKEGIGSGVCVQHADHPVNLVTLYRAPKAERAGSALNKLLNNDRDQLTPAVQELCEQADAIVLVIDVTQPHNNEDTSLLNAMISCCSPHTPALVLACSMQGSEVSPPPLSWVQSLELSSLSVPWQVRELRLDTYTGLEQGLDWLLTASQ